MDSLWKASFYIFRCSVSLLSRVAWLVYSSFTLLCLQVCRHTPAHTRLLCSVSNSFTGCMSQQHVRAWYIRMRHCSLCYLHPACLAHTCSSDLTACRGIGTGMAWTPASGTRQWPCEWRGVQRESLNGTDTGEDRLEWGHTSFSCPLASLALLHWGHPVEDRKINIIAWSCSRVVSFASFGFATHKWFGEFETSPMVWLNICLWAWRGGGWGGGTSWRQLTPPSTPPPDFKFHTDFKIMLKTRLWTWGQSKVQNGARQMHRMAHLGRVF